MPEVRVSRDASSAASRDKIMDVAEGLLARDGYAGTSISAICAGAGLPVGSIYHHFGSKVGLLRAVTERGAKRFFAELPVIALDAGGPELRTVEHFRAAARTVLANLAFFRIDATLVLHPPADPEVRAVMAEIHAATDREVSAVLSRIAAEAGVPDPEEMGRYLAAMTIIFTRGAVGGIGGAGNGIEEAMDGLGRLVWHTIARSRQGAAEPNGAGAPAQETT